MLRTILLVIGAVVLCDCANGPMRPSARNHEPKKAAVRRVDFRQAPEMRGLAERTRQIGNEAYPKILKLMGNESAKVPQQFDIVFKKQVVTGGLGETRPKRATIYLSADWFTENPTGLDWFAKDPTNLDMVLIHEMAHVAQQYKDSQVPSYWCEGMADYVRYKFGYTNGWSCPQCSEQYPHYTSGYWCAGAFLLYVEATCGSNIIRQLNTHLRQGSYSDAFFARATGKALNELWAEFQKTSAFKPGALEAYQLQQRLGYVNGKPPKDLEVRFEAYVKQQPGGAFTLDAGKFLDELRKKGQLPGFAKGEPVWMERGERGRMPFAIPKEGNPETFPATRYFYFFKTTGDPSAFQYIIVRRASNSGWTLQKAWRTGPNGDVLEEYPVH